MLKHLLDSLLHVLQPLVQLCAKDFPPAGDHFEVLPPPDEPSDPPLYTDHRLVQPLIPSLGDLLEFLSAVLNKTVVSFLHPEEFLPLSCHVFQEGALVVEFLAILGEVNGWVERFWVLRGGSEELMALLLLVGRPNPRES